MKVAPAKTRAFLAKLPSHLAGLLLYGPNQGLVKERLQALQSAHIEDPGDPFGSCVLTGEDITTERFFQEVTAMAFGGGRRVVIVKSAADSIAGAVRNYFEAPPPDGALVLITAGELTPRSPLRKAFEASEVAAAIPCYAEDARGLTSTVQRMLQQEGVRIDREALQLLCQGLGDDLAHTRMEVEKLVLYAGVEKHITFDMVEESLTTLAERYHDHWLHAMTTHKVAPLIAHLNEAFASGKAPILLLRVAQSHLLALHDMAVAVDKGSSTSQVLARVFFKWRPQFEAALRVWTPSKLMAALAVLHEAELLTKSSSQPQRLRTEAALLRVARMVRASGRGSPPAGALPAQGPGLAGKPDAAGF